MIRSTSLPVIGTNTLVSIAKESFPVPAKVDTGADGTAVWASDVHINNRELCFVLFDASSPFYSGTEYRTTEFRIIQVTGSTGKSEVRFSVKLPMLIEGRRMRVWCSLADRSKRRYPILIGRRTLKNKFVVDVASYAVPPKKKVKELRYYDEFMKNPEQFIKAHGINSKNKKDA